MTAILIAITIAAALAILLIAVKRQGDRAVDAILGWEAREVARRREAGIQSGFDAGWHGGSGRA